ncbi:hypothetical protein NEDG_00947 [Nematocida displodere]|uniref:GOLD domain-containing protein n=1 Tax=Nematocida displodere TaxID=1805483 RepID=A0A177EAI5_9MICR|nr:hypothetical protein NEDG_00947 [Nematocida displodere]
MKVLFLLALFCGAARSFIEPFQRDQPIIAVKDLKKSTVALGEVKVYTRKIGDMTWRELQTKERHSFASSSAANDSSDHYYGGAMSMPDDLDIQMTVYESPTQEWSSLPTVSKNAYISQTEQSGSKCNFFWTASGSGFFMFLFRVGSDTLNHKGYELGLDVALYEGRPEDPSIYSHADSQIKHKEKRISECIKISKEITELQSLDKQEQDKYTEVSNAIFRVVVLMVFLKIVIFVGSFVLINRKIQDFYVSKKIVVS